MFAGMIFTVFDAVVTITNSINSNNNNNNNQNLNLQSSSNTAISGNVNVANQINVKNMMGKRRKRETDLLKDPRLRSLALQAMNMMQDFKFYTDQTTYAKRFL